jgi:hypothetical protein
MNKERSNWRRRLPARARGAQIRPILELLEARNLLSNFTNVGVSNPASDPGPAGGFTQSETTLVVGGGVGFHNVFAGFNDSESFNGSNGKFTGYAVSTDGGTTWTDMGALPTSPNGDAGDPVMATLAPTPNSPGAVYFTTLAFSGTAIPFFSSTGNAFVTPAVNAAPGFTPGDFLDKDWMAVDNFPGPGNGNIYVTCTDFGPGGTTRVALTRSTNGGASFGPSGGTTIFGPVVFPPNEVQGSYIVVEPNHNVDVFLFGHFGAINQLGIAKSTDFGATFSPVTLVTNLATTTLNGDLGLTVSNSNPTAIRTNSFPHAAVNPVNGNLYLVYNDKVDGTDKSNIYFIQSTNGGATWSAPFQVNDDKAALGAAISTNDNWQPDIAVTPDGTHLGIFWYDRRTDPNNSLINWFGETAAISGATVTFGSHNIRVTPSAFPPVLPGVIHTDPLVNPGYMGDYDTVGADNFVFYTTWGDNRNIGFVSTAPDVFFARIPVNAQSGPNPFLRDPIGETGGTGTVVGGSVEAWTTALTAPFAFATGAFPVGLLPGSANSQLPAATAAAVIQDSGTVTARPDSTQDQPQAPEATASVSPSSYENLLGNDQSGGLADSVAGLGTADQFWGFFGGQV